MQMTDRVGIKGRASVFVNKKCVCKVDNTITYAGFQWFLRQATGVYARPIQGIRIGNGGGDGGFPLTNDPALVDVRAPIIGTVGGVITYYVPYLSPYPLNFTSSVPWVAIIDCAMDQALYQEDDYKANGQIVNEAGLWVPPPVGGNYDSPNAGGDAILVSYTVFKTAAGVLVNVPIIEGADIFVRWEIIVS
jgi:hypothetical protein